MLALLGKNKMNRYIVLNDGETFSSIEGCFLIETEDKLEDILELSSKSTKILITDIIDPIRSSTSSNSGDLFFQN